MRICTRCKKPRRTEQFNWQKVGVRRSTICAFCHRDRNNQRNRRLRLGVLKHYGGDPPRCACCGVREIEFLSLDHVNGGGRQHRKSIKIRWWEWLLRHGLPEGFRVLCHNCNQSIGIYGYCPHDSGSEIDKWASYDLRIPNRGYKLTPEIVAEIRAKIEEGTAQNKIAQEYKVSRATICLINKGKRWGDGPS